MVGEKSSWGRRLFPEISISLSTAKRPATISLPPFVPALVLFAAIAGAAALAFLGFGRIGANRLIAERDAAVTRTESVNADLQDDIAGLHDKLAEAGRDHQQSAEKLSAAAGESAALRSLLSDTRAKLHALQAEAEAAAHQTALAGKPSPPEAGRIAQLSTALDQARLALHQAAAEGATLSARLSKTEVERDQERAQYEATAKQLQSAIGELERELLRHSAAARKGAAAPAGSRARRFADLGREGVGAIERVLASAGINVARLFSRFGIDRGEGGPFVAPRPGGAAARPITPQQLAALRGLMQSLPLGTPVAHYEIASGFGERTDPFNHRRAVHTGIDFDAPYMSAVYATAAGTVVYAGYRGAYGKIVEIDHGDGIHTLYGHLHRVAVAVGQKVAAHAQIGWLGSTGRSSGPHVHYEVLVNGEPQDPEKFIGLAQLIPAAAR